MNDDQALRDQWDKLLAAHRELVWAYLQALETNFSPVIAQQVRATSLQIGSLSNLLGLSLDL